MVDAWSKYKQFVQLRKTHNQSISEFIAEFERAYMKTKESGCDFLDTILAFNLLEACNLSETDEKFVLTAVDFQHGKAAKDLFLQVKNSLQKFQGRDKLTSSDNDSRLKVEADVYLAHSMRKTLLEEGWKPPVNYVRNNSLLYKWKKNPLGTDGLPLKCYNCHSEYHLADKCDKKSVENEPKSGRTKVMPSGTAYSMLSTVAKNGNDAEFVMVSHNTENNKVWQTGKRN